MTQPSAFARFLDVIRPCKRVLRTIDENIEVTRELQQEVCVLKNVMEELRELNKPGPDGKYHRRADDTTEPPVFRR